MGLDAYVSCSCEVPGGACPHAGTLASERISNWGGYRAFQEALGRVGWERFPTLHAELPEGNGGEMAAAQAALALDELAAFTQASQGIEEIVLVDSDTDKVEYDYVASYQGVFVWNGSRGYEVGFDPEGLFVRKPETQGGEELFRALRVDRPPGAFVDRDTGTRLECPLDWGAGRRFHVTRRPAPVSRYAHIVESLAIVCRAAVASGNPVIWT